MSKPKEKDLPGSNPGDPMKDVLTIEEHKKNLKISGPVFEAVMQTKKWGSGKRVSEAVFKTAVEEFLCAPADGAKAPAPEAVSETASKDAGNSDEPAGGD